MEANRGVAKHEAYRVTDTGFEMLLMDTDMFEVARRMKLVPEAQLELDVAVYRALQALRWSKERKVQDWNRLMGVGVYEGEIDP